MFPASENIDFTDFLHVFLLGGREIGLPFFLYGYSTKYYLLDIIGNIIAEVLPGHEYTVCTAGFVFV